MKVDSLLDRYRLIQTEKIFWEMPPKRKQTPRNGFYYFMQDFKNRHGRNYRSMQEVADAAGPHWAVRYIYIYFFVILFFSV